MCEYLSFYFLRKKMQCHLLDVFVQSLLWHIRIVLISPYKKHPTVAAVAIGGPTSTPAVVNLRFIVEYWYEYAYYFVGSCTYLGIYYAGTSFIVPGTFFLV